MITGVNYMISIKRVFADFVNNWAYLVFVTSSAFALSALFGIMVIEPFDYPNFNEYSLDLLRKWAVLIGGVTIAYLTKDRI